MSAMGRWSLFELLCGHDICASTVAWKIFGCIVHIFGFVKCFFIFNGHSERVTGHACYNVCPFVG